jgi:cell wall-associated NlpC family hydrolase
MSICRGVLRGVVLALCACGAFGAGGAAHAQSAPKGLVDTASGALKDVASSAWHTAQALSSHALGLLGVEYRRGGDSPETGLDCSGLVRYVFQQVTGLNLPRTAREMSEVGAAVALGDLKPGDLVFFNTQRFAFSHVGIYLGDNQFIHAPRRGREVQISALDRRYWLTRFDGARRLVGVLPEIVPSLVGEAQAAPDRAVAAEAAYGAPRPLP